MQNEKIGHLCYMRPLSNELPRSHNVLFVSYDFETTQKTRFTDSATEHVPNLVCLQQFCSLCENLSDIDENCERCGKRKHSFLEDPVGDLLTHLCETRSWCDRAIAIAHNARGYDAQFMLQRAIFLKWNPKLILNGSKIICMKMENLTFSTGSHTCRYLYASYPRHSGFLRVNRGIHIYTFTLHIHKRKSELCWSDIRRQPVRRRRDERFRKTRLSSLV